MVPEPYRYTWYLKQVMAGLQYFLKTLISLKVENF
jgi:hypothetical protein